MNRAERRRAVKSGKTPDPLAITWYSNAIWAPTGYGTQTRQVVERLDREGHHVAIANNYGLMATQMVYDGIPHYPMGIDGYSNDVIGPIFQDWSRQHRDSKPLTIALYDAWPLKGPAWDMMPTAIWTMVDHDRVPPAVLEFLQKSNVMPLAASMHAHEQIQNAGAQSLYVPMAVDTNLYRPTATWSNGDKRMTGRQLMGFDEDVFVVSLINANKSANGVHRKAWGENLDAFAIFAARHDDVRLYIHTERHGKYGGVHLNMLIADLGIPDHKVKFVNQWAQHNGIPNEAMAALYTATDVLLASTYGEGFGLTVLEAGACETPAIVSDFTCQPELISEDSFLVGGQSWWDDMQGARWQIPDVMQIVDALEASYQRGRFRSPKQREHALNYDADLIFEQRWKPALAALTADPSGAIEPVVRPATWTRNDDIEPLLSIYIPTYKRTELGRLLSSLAPQLDERVEVIISDNDPDGLGYGYVVEYLSGTGARVDYSRRKFNIGGDANILRGFHVGTAPWIWIMGDDDWALPGAVSRIIEELCDTVSTDRLILLSDDAPRGAAGYCFPLPELATYDPALPIAATLITANVVRRSALNLTLATEKLDTMYAHSWANTSCNGVYVIPEPCIGVGTDYANSTPIGLDGVLAIWADLLRAYGIEPSSDSFAWNFASPSGAGVNLGRTFPAPTVPIN